MMDFHSSHIVFKVNWIKHYIQIKINYGTYFPILFLEK